MKTKIYKLSCMLIITLAHQLIISSSFAQAPQGISHQAVIRNAANELITNSLIGIKVSILQGSPEGTVVYSETHLPTSNANGLISFVIGQGVVINGVFTEIDWAAGPYFLKTEADPMGGNSYTIEGISQMMSVPYALHTASSEDNYWLKNGDNIHYPGGYVGIGTDNPFVKLDIRGNNTDDGAAFRIGNSDGSHTLTLFSGRENDPLPFIWWKDGDPLRFCTDKNGWSEKMRIGIDGKVGIGNSEPVGTLDVVGEDSIRAIFSAAGGANNLTSGIMLRSTFGGDIPDYGPKNLALIKAHFDGGAWGNAALTFHIAGDDCMTDGDTDPCERMRINALGNLGIGTSSPENRLHIVAESDPLRLEGLQPTSTLNTYLVADENGVVYKRSGGGSGAASWELTGNSGTSASENFIGTTDSTAFRIKVNNWQSGWIDPAEEANMTFGYRTLEGNTSGALNTAIGYMALFMNDEGIRNTATGYGSMYSNTSGHRNTAYGLLSLFSNTSGVGNTAIGHSSLYYSTGNNNTALGRYASMENTTGNSNVAIGISALYKNNDRSNIVAVGDSALFWNGFGAAYDNEAIANTAVGSKALYSNTSGDHNTAIGFGAMISNVSGYRNTAVGESALYGNDWGHMNTATGASALFNNLTGQENTAIGESSMHNNIDGVANTALGRHSLYLNSSGTGNTALGSFAGYHLTGGSHNIFIGSSSGPVTDQIIDSSMWLGTTGTNRPAIFGDLTVGKIGIGTTNPSGQLDIVGVDSVRVIISSAEGANSLTSGIMLKSTFGGDIPDFMSRNLALLKAHFDGGAWGNATLAFHVAGDDCTTDGDTDPCERMRITSGGNVGIGTSVPESSAILDVASNDKGFLPPRLTTAQMNAIASPAEGLTIYNTSVKSLCYYDGASWIVSREGKSCGDINYGGKTYSTIIIGTQCWMAENLNIGTRINGTINQTNSGTTEKYCYDNLESNCDVYGGLYQWDEAMNYTTTPGVQGICPDGWHLPSDGEWTILTTYVSCQAAWLCNSNTSYIAKAVASTINWSTSSSTCAIGNNLAANNASGFSGLPGGDRIANGSFASVSYIGSWWSSTENSSMDAWFQRLEYRYAHIERNPREKNFGFSVRCLRNN